jgi:histidine phosphotransferase ChpT
MAEPGETVRLFELISARLCHDFGGLIGTLGNAIDMVAEEGDGESEVLAFATSASKVLTQRLRLMRTAWGPETEAMTLVALLALAVPPLAARRIGLDPGNLAPDCGFTPETGRVVLNLILLAGDSLPRGGLITLAGEPDDLFIRIDGPGAAWPAGLVSCMHDEEAAIKALSATRSMQMGLTVLLAVNRKLRLSPVFGQPSGIVALRLDAA